MSERTDWDEEFDFVSVGGGGGGHAGAAAAAVQGARVLLLEKAAALGGVTSMSEGEIWVAANFVERAGGEADSFEAGLAYLEFLSAGLGDAGLREHFLRKSNEAIEFFEQHAGLGLQVMPNRVDYYFPEAPGSKGAGRYLEITPFDARALGPLEELVSISPYSSSRITQGDVAAVAGGRDQMNPASVMGELEAVIAERVANHELCGGSGLVARLLHTAVGAGAEVRVNTRVERLIGDGEGVVGIETSSPEGSRRIKAANVLLATGGYDYNPELVRLYEQHAELGSVASPDQTGDHIAMAGELGAMVTMRPPYMTPLLTGARWPDPEAPGGHGMTIVFPGRPHGIFVNRDGQRFGDEAFFPTLHSAQMRFDGPNMRYANLPTWFVFDQSFRDKYNVGHFPPGEPLPEGLAVSAETLEETAELAGVDAANLAATVARFNGFCAAGSDEDFGRGTRVWSEVSVGDESMPNPVLGPLEKPPYYAIELTPMTAGVPSAGLKIDGEARVVNTRGRSIRGLFAAGNAAGVVNFLAYQSGTSISRGLTHGYLAGSAATAAL